MLSMDETVSTPRKKRRTPRPSTSQLVMIEVIKTNGGTAPTRLIKARLIEEGFFSPQSLISMAEVKGVIRRLRVGLYALPTD